MRELVSTYIERKDVEVIFLDETSFNLWQMPTRLWLRADMKLEIPNSRGTSIAMVGALSMKRGLVHVNIFEGTNNASTFLKFVLELKA